MISKCNDDTRSSKLLADTLDSILDMFGSEINDEERSKLASQITIVPDSQMSYTDKFPVDIILNASGAIRRLNPGQLHEVDLNFQAEAIREKLTTLPTLEEKEKLIFEFLSMLDKDEYEFYIGMYTDFTKKYKIDSHNVWITDQEAKEAFIKNVEEKGFYLIKQQDSPIRYAAITAIYEKFDFIKPLPLYIDIFGTMKRRCAKDAIVADKYMMILKHNNNKNFSARSTYRVNRANLPAKDNTKRNNRSQYSHSPVRIGESYNLMSSISGALLAEYNIFMRSSTLGRKSLKQILETEGNPLEIKRLELKDNYINANADIFNAKAKTLGLRLKFVSENSQTPDMIEDVVTPLKIGKFTIMDSPLKRDMYNRIFAIFMNEMENITFIEEYPGHKEDYVWEKVFALDEVKAYNLSDESKDLIIRASKNKGIVLNDVIKEEVIDNEEDNSSESEE